MSESSDHTDGHTDGHTDDHTDDPIARPDHGDQQGEPPETISGEPQDQNAQDQNAQDQNAQDQNAQDRRAAPSAPAPPPPAPSPRTEWHNHPQSLVSLALAAVLGAALAIGGMLAARGLDAHQVHDPAMHSVHHRLAPAAGHALGEPCAPSISTFRGTNRAPQRLERDFERFLKHHLERYLGAGQSQGFARRGTPKRSHSRAGHAQNCGPRAGMGLMEPNSNAWDSNAWDSNAWDSNAWDSGPRDSSSQDSSSRDSSSRDSSSWTPKGGSPGGQFPDRDAMTTRYSADYSADTHTP